MKDTIHMVLKGFISEHFVSIETTIYRKYIWHNKKGKPMLYGMLQADLLFWKL